MRERIQQLLLKSDAELNFKVRLDDFVQFLNYRNYNQNIRNPNFDCSEIMDDLMMVIKDGKECIIENKKAIYATFVVLEWGEPKDYVNHYVLVKNNVVFDPRFYDKPVTLEVYKEILQLLNPNAQLSYKM